MISMLQGLSKLFLQRVEQNVMKFTRLTILSSQSKAINSNQQIRGFHDKGVLKLRCKNCYFRKLDDRWWVLCNVFPRHKQREKVEDYREKWIVTHITRNGRPFQKKPEAYICNTSPPAAYDYKKRIWHWQDVEKHGHFPRLRKGHYRF